MGAPDVIAGRSWDRARAKSYTPAAPRLLQPRGTASQCRLAGSQPGCAGGRELAICRLPSAASGRSVRGRPPSSQGRCRNPGGQRPPPRSFVAQQRHHPAALSESPPGLADPSSPACSERRDAPTTKDHHQTSDEHSAQRQLKFLQQSKLAPPVFALWTPTTRYVSFVLNGVVMTRSPPKQVPVMTGLSMVAGAPGKYISYGVIQISRTNAMIIGVMIVLFVLAIVVPFPTHDDEQPKQEGHRR